jgi:DNA-binding NtrC family response regulator
MQKRILIVEDEGIVGLNLRRLLEDLGYQVVGVASTGVQAIEIADRELPDLALMDIHLGGEMNGIEAANEMTRRRRLPIVFLTAYVDPQTVDSAKSVEPYGYLVKPFERQNLRTTIEMALHKADVDRAIRGAHDDLSAIVGAQRQGTILLDRSRRAVFVSQAAKRILRLSGECDAPGLEELFHSDSRVVPLIAKAIDQGGTRRLNFQLHGRPMECELFDDPRTEDRTILVLAPSKAERRAITPANAEPEMIGESAATQLVKDLIRQFAAVEAPVLIEGETGVGKDLVARAIHQQSARKDKAFLALNCAGLSAELAASQLFGHRRGAFTGAESEHPGLFEAAHGGTLFLDEVGELPSRVQTTLLRVLEERAVMRVGETSLRPVDVRIIAATNRRLIDEVEMGRFRADLLYRIRVARIEVAPLRERIDDLPLLIDYFLGQHCVTIGKQIHGVAPSALDLLLTYAWPGNVRELRNALEYAVIRSAGPEIEAADLPPEITELPAARRPSAPAGLEREQIVQALQKAGGNRKLAAAQLGISRATFYRRLAQLNIGVNE